MLEKNNEYRVIDDKYEYLKIALKGNESKYIYIPWSVILNSIDFDSRRVAVFSYMRIHCCLNDTINFMISNVVKWCGGKPDRRMNGANDKFLNTIDVFRDKGYLTYLTERSRSSYMECIFDMDYYCKECSNGYATVYLDEIEKIMKYKKENSNNNILTNATILLVFTYLRYKIIRRPNELNAEERFHEKIKERRERLPEAYNGNISDMAKEIGISSKTFLKIIDILEKDLKLIVTDKPYRIKNDDGEFRTPPTIFANAYKREYRYFLITGERYSRMEIELKAKQIEKYYNGYRINKNKRRKQL